METRLRLSIAPQPDDTTCGPTCLEALYRYYGDDLSLEQVISEVTPLETGGTLAVFLACHALQRGYRATIYTYNLQLFDPTWFQEKPRDIPRRLEAQAAVKDDSRMRVSSDAYLEFFRLGGQIRFEDLRPSLIRRYLVKERPILTGLSATYLYHCERERDDNEYDSIAGSPTGHFVILCGYDRKSRQVLVADPQSENPMTGTQYYTVGIERVIGAILLGIVTYDANLLIIEPAGKAGR
jgi:hypothetical protein